VAVNTGDAGLPAHFFGAWERSALTLDGTPVADAGRAVWVQAGAAFVDVRGPGGFASDTCFAGTTKWSEPYLAWTHVIDRAGTEDGEDALEGEDKGHITFDGDDLIEQGSFIAGATREYAERWTRLPGPLAPVLAAASADGRCVRVGDHAAAVVDRRATGGEFVAAYWRWSDSEWRLELEIDGEVASLPPPLEPGAALMDGWHWHTEAEVPA
jgi:Protein HRI1